MKKILIQLFDSLDEPHSMSVVLISDERMKKMNTYYRHKNYPTDVLSFENPDNQDSYYLGDVFIALRVSQKQAQKNGHNWIREISFLALHGYLHLKGYNDDTEKGLQQMIDIQENILAKNKFLFSTDRL